MRNRPAAGAAAARRLGVAPCPFERIKGAIEKLPEHKTVLVRERGEARDRFGRGLDVELDIAARATPALDDMFCRPGALRRAAGKIIGLGYFADRVL